MSLTSGTFTSPVPEAQRWVRGRSFPADRPLLNVSQAAPVLPPPEALTRAMAEALTDPATHLYSADLGIAPLRAALAVDYEQQYGGAVTAEEVAITSGCNQAFAATIAALCDHGDQVILPVPWYFNHKMWLDMAGMETVPLATGPDLLPDPEAARALITPRTRAIVLVTPNNPGGVEYPPALIGAFFNLAAEHGIRLIIDETYRDFRASDGPAHDLFTRPNWQDTLVALYSFSKAYRMTGHRVGALVCHADLMPEVEKFIDTVTICPSGVGQRAALWGLQNLGDWLAGERAEILRRKDAVAAGFDRLAANGWRLRGIGAYFAYVEHPFALPSDQVARRLVDEASILALPGTMFVPQGDASGARCLRIAFANIDGPRITELTDRLARLDWPLATPDSAA